MSGTEAVAILGVISAIISIIDGTKQVYDATASAKGLPEAFTEVASRLPIITNILGAVEQYIKDGDITEDLYKGVKQVIQACRDKAKQLEDIFRKVIPGENALRRERYFLAVKTLGKGNEVEKLMKGILEDVQLLVGEHNMKIATKDQVEQIAKAVKEVSAIPPSIPENELQEHSFIANYCGSGTQYNAQGEYIAQGNARQYNAGGGPMHFDQRTFYTQEAADLRETPPIPSSTVPFPRDADYVDRQALLERVSAKYSIPGSRTVLVGLGGVGKSQVAIEFSYHVRDQSLDSWVFWVHASNAARVEQSYREIADRVKIPSRKDPKANIYNLVQNWLCDQTKGKWCLIFDNIDDYRVLNEVLPAGQDGQGSALRRPLLTYLPQSGNGSILMTTRSMEVALRVVERSDIIEVQPMAEAHAITLFEKKLGKQSDSKDVAELAGVLEFMPLAIVQAAAYISQRAPRSSVQQYLEEFRRSDRKKTSLLNHEGGHLHRDWEAKNSIITTWQISFEHIRRERPSAADLLSLMSFFDRQGIPETLIRCGDVEQKYKKLEGAYVHDKDDNEDNTSESSGDDEYEDDILTLRNYSFISANTDKLTFEMHRLVQLATQVWLNAYGQLERWKRQFITNLVTQFPLGEYKNWAKCQPLFPHAKAAISQRPDEKDSLQEWASILYQAAWYALVRGNMNDAEEMSLKSANARRKLFGQEHSSTLNSMNILASTYQNQGRWDKAKELQLQVIEAWKKLLGEEHPFTLTVMANLASTYTDQGRWKEAEELFMEVLEMWKKALGAEHPSALIIMANLATTYRKQGRWDEAEKLEVQVLKTSKRILGAEHPSTLTIMANLATTYTDQGRWKEAEGLEVHVLETRKSVLGAEHPDTLAIMANLATTYRIHRTDKAKELEVGVRETWERLFGVEHPDMLTIIANRASTYANQGQWKEAEELDVQVLETRKRVLGARHPDTLTSMANLALTWKNRGRDIGALKLLEECVQLRSRILGSNHPDTLLSSEALSCWQAE